MSARWLERLHHFLKKPEPEKRVTVRYFTRRRARQEEPMEVRNGFGVGREKRASIAQRLCRLGEVVPA